MAASIKKEEEIRNHELRQQMIDTMMNNQQFMSNIMQNQYFMQQLNQ